MGRPTTMDLTGRFSLPKLLRNPINFGRKGKKNKRTFMSTQIWDQKSVTIKEFKKEGENINKTRMCTLMKRSINCVISIITKDSIVPHHESSTWCLSKSLLKGYLPFIQVFQCLCLKIQSKSKEMQMTWKINCREEAMPPNEK